MGFLAWKRSSCCFAGRCSTLPLQVTCQRLRSCQGEIKSFFFLSFLTSLSATIRKFLPHYPFYRATKIRNVLSVFFEAVSFEQKSENSMSRSFARRISRAAMRRPHAMCSRIMPAKSHPLVGSAIRSEHSCVVNLPNARPR